MIASCSTDGTLRLFDLRSPLPPSSSSAPVVPGAPQPQPPTNANLTVPAHPSEILSLSWNKYRPFVIATAGVDKSVKSWDCRMIKTSGGGVGGTCEIELKGHEYAVRKVQWSPHRSDVLASASYDMTCRVCVLLSPLSSPFSLFTTEDDYEKQLVNSTPTRPTLPPINPRSAH
jgi:peroxin-7